MEKKEYTNKTVDAKKLGELSRMSYVPIQKDIIKHKEYLATVRALLDNVCEYDGDERIISEKDLKAVMRQIFDLRKRKIDAVVRVYEELEILTKREDGMYVINFMKPFVSLNPQTVQYCLTTLSELCFKVYCYLKYMYDYHLDKGYNTPLTFSVQGENGLLSVCGYCDNGSDNRKKMNWVLETLQKVGLIEISAPTPIKDESNSFHGWYRVLYKVNDKSSAQFEVELQEFIEGHVYQEYPLDCQPSPMFVDRKKYLYNKDAFKDRKVFYKLLLDKRNKDAFEDALIFDEIPKNNVESVERVVRQWGWGKK